MRKALVTASSQGLGRACAESLLQAGLSVTLNGRDSARLEAARQACAVQFGAARVASLPAELGRSDHTPKLLEAAASCDVLVLNLGGPPTMDVLEMGAKEWQASLQALFVPAAEIVTTAVAAMMARGWGRVVFISSIGVKSPLPQLIPSSVSRLGLTGLMAGLAPKAIAQGVTLNSILPGRIWTDRQQRAVRREARAAGRSDEAQHQLMSQLIPAGRFGRPEEVGALCQFLCGDSASYLTNQNILVDGGLYQGLF
ncbi:MAG: SDR family oxidoreductase [Pigmentiphaga sp.]|nr:SDR family oxidoreductase [Pigmentiphaga sp.]